MLPKTLALVDNDREFAAGLADHLRRLGVARVDCFADSNDLLVHPDPYTYEFYIVDPHLPGISARELITMLRRRSDVGIVVLTGQRRDEVFKEAITAGADMVVSKPAGFDEVALAVTAVQRRTRGGDTERTAWRLDRRAAQLIAPNGARVALSPADLALLECFVGAGAAVVPREALLKGLGRPGDAAVAGGLNASIFRLRRRVERGALTALPLDTQSGVGYMFRAPLTAL